MEGMTDCVICLKSKDVSGEQCFIFVNIEKLRIVLAIHRCIRCLGRCDGWLSIPYDFINCFGGGLLYHPLATYGRRCKTVGPVED